MRIVICDDDRQSRENLLFLCKKHLDKNEATIDDFESGAKLCDSDLSTIDIAFLDIEMPGENGLTVASKIHQANAKCLIIFVTSYNEYITEAMRNYAFQFLTKPVKEKDLVIELKRAKDEFSRRISRIVILCDGAERVIEVSKILYVESDNKHVNFVLNNGEVFSTRAKLNMFCDFLFGKNFVSLHKSYLVNMFYIKEFNSQSVTLDNGQVLPLSRSKSEEFKTAFNRYLNGVHYV